MAYYRTFSACTTACIVFLMLFPEPREGLPAEFSLQPHGFIEVAAGPRWGDGRSEKEGYSLLEGRFQLKCMLYPEQPALFADWNAVFFFKGELIMDAHEEEPDGWIREFYLQASPASFLDLKAGRQILTWGTGDLIFVNDLFPKDFVSFFIGRDEEYLKVPSDAIKLSFFTSPVNLDLVCIPFFRPDTPIRGERLSFYNPFTRSRDGRDAGFYFNKPGRSLQTMEFAARLYRLAGSYEIALYGFWGYYKQAAGVKSASRREVYYPELNVFGGSIRGPVLGGIGSCEFGFYRSKEDTAGHDPLIENSSIQYLAGYERQFKNDLTFSFQYYLNQLRDYHDYTISLPHGLPRRDHFYQLLTMRVTKLLLYQNLELSLFVFYSPSDDDVHVRPRVTYDVTDAWQITVGCSLFDGRHGYTNFGQLSGNNMTYMRLRYSF